jgi:hypothetical protein
MFNEVQQKFLDQHKIPTSLVMDGTGLKGKALKQLMTDGNYLVAVCTTPCAAAGHTMKMKSGHCVQCNPQNIGFRANFYRPGSVYILQSKATKLIKVGSTGAPLDERVKKLNAVRYGRTDDWTLFASQEFDEAGKIEFSMQAVLRAHREISHYEGQSRDGECHEIFNCSAKFALAALKTAAAQNH